MSKYKSKNMTDTSCNVLCKKKNGKIFLNYILKRTFAMVCLFERHYLKTSHLKTSKKVNLYLYKMV